MNACDVIGYVYDADTHCSACAITRFGEHPHSPPLYPWCRDDIPDNEGNMPCPIFADSEWGRTVECATCDTSIPVNIIPEEGA